MSKIYEIYGTDAHEMTKALMQAAGIADKIAASFPRNANIALKPNLILAARPEEGATTHAGVLSGCIEYLLSNRCFSEWVQFTKKCGSKDL